MKKPIYIYVLQLTKSYYPVILMYSVVISFLTLATPISVQSLVSTLTFGPYIKPLMVLSLILLALLFILGCVKSLQYLLVEYLQRKLFAKLTAKVGLFYGNSENINQESKYFANRFYDVVLIQKTLSFLAVEVISVFLQTSLGLILICIYHPYFILFSVFILLGMGFPLYLYIKESKFTAIKESTNKHELSEFIQRKRDNELVHKGMKEYQEDLSENIKKYLDARASHFKLLFRKNIIFISLYAFFNAFLLALGGVLVVSNQLSVGQLVAAEIVINGILYYFLNASKYIEYYYDMFAAAEKLRPFLEKDEDGALDVTMMESCQSVYEPTESRKMLRRLVVFSLVIFGLFLLVPWQQTSFGEGRVTALDPNHRTQDITATVSGRVEEWLVREGQVVKKGDPIVKVVDNDPNYMVRLESRRDAAVAKFEAAKTSSDTARLNYNRQKKLVKEGLSADKEFEKAKITYQKLVAEEASAAANLAKAEVDFSRQQLQVITAPRDGRIFRILMGSGTTNVKVGQNLAQFIPEHEGIGVELFLDGNDLPLVSDGRKVRVQFEGWPAVQLRGWPSVAIGSFGGTVQSVDHFVSSNGQFRVLVKPDLEDEAWPGQEFLRQGTRTLGVVLLEEVSIGYELWRKINGFPKSLSQKLSFKEKSKTKKSKSKK